MEVLLLRLFLPGMKNTILFSTVLTALVFTSCGNHDDTEHAKKQFPKPGTIVAEAKMPIMEDTINHFTFSVKVVADSEITSGVYDVDADFGPNFGEGKFSMPKGAEDAKPAIRKGTEPYTWIIGFHVPGDTTFYDYFEVSSSKNNTKMQYIKSYTF